MATGPLMGGIKDPLRYKMSICANWLRDRSCPYGRRRQFAHGEKQLRHRRPSPSMQHPQMMMPSAQPFIPFHLPPAPGPMEPWMEGAYLAPPFAFHYVEPFFPSCGDAYPEQHAHIEEVQTVDKLALQLSGSCDMAADDASAPRDSQHDDSRARRQSRRSRRFHPSSGESARHAS
eukprot:7277174-Prymnesium_polylepis.2